MNNEKECLWYYIEMVDTDLINYREVISWADKKIMACDMPPSWMCDLSISHDKLALINNLRDAACEGLELSEIPTGLVMFHLACLYLRWSQNELSAKDFLLLSGDYLDGVNGAIDCSVMYGCLSKIENGGNEVQVIDDCAKRIELGKWIQMATMHKKSINSENSV